MIQCDQIERFLKVLGDKYLSKVAQMFGDFCGIETIIFKQKLSWLLFGQL